MDWILNPAKAAKDKSDDKKAQEAQDAQDAAYEKRKQDIKDAEDLAKFATTEGQGVAKAATIDLSLEDEEDWMTGTLNNRPGLFL